MLSHAQRVRSRAARPRDFGRGATTTPATLLGIRNQNVNTRDEIAATKRYPSKRPGTPARRRVAQIDYDELRRPSVTKSHMKVIDVASPVAHDSVAMRL